jgi:predicted DNA binding protein
MTMRKLILEVEPNERAKEGLEQMFKHIDSYEILEMLKVDYEQGLCVDLIEVNLKEGVSINDVAFIGKNEIMSVLRSEGNKHICLVKYYEDEESMELFKEFDLDLIASSPIIISPEKLTISYIGENENLTKLVELIKTHAGTITNMTFKKAAYQKQDLISVLTDKQKQILIAANKFGYYDYPKKINSEELSKKVNISKATLVQHLRKAEGRLMANIFAGYLSK